MPGWVVTPDDLKRGDLAKVGWHPAEIIEYSEATVTSAEAKNPGSLNCIFKFKIIDGPSVGIVAQKLFNETAWGFAKNFFAAMEYPKDPQSGGYQISSSLFNQSVGHKLMIYIKTGKSNKGNEFNDVQDFKPLKAS